MKPLSIELTNFRSFKNSRLDLSELVSPTLITAENLDDPGSDSNGAGKTAGLMEPHPYAIFGYTPLLNSVDDVIRDSDDSCIVDVSYKVNQDLLRIIRERNRNGSKSLIWELNGKSQIEGKTTDTQIQLDLLKYLGISDNSKDRFNDFMNTTYLTSSTTKSFLSEAFKSSERMEMLTRMLSLDLYDASSKEANNRITVLEKELDDLNTKLNTYSEHIKVLNEDEIKKEISNIKDEIRSLSDRLPDLKQVQKLLESDIKIGAEIDLIRNDILVYNNIKKREIEMLVNELTEINNKLSDLNSLILLKDGINNNIIDLLKPYKGIDPDEILLEIDSGIELSKNRINKEMNEININKNDLTNLISKVNHDIQVSEQSIKYYSLMLNAKLVCPYCDNPLIYEKGGLSKLDIDMVGNLIKLETEKIEKYHKEITICNDSIKVIDTKILLLKSDTELKNLINRKEVVKSSVLSLKSEKNKLNDIEKKLSELSILEKSITLKQSKIRILTDDLNTFNINSDHKISLLLDGINITDSGAVVELNKVNNDIIGIDNEIKYNQKILNDKNNILLNEIQKYHVDIKIINDRKEAIQISLEELHYWKSDFQDIKRSLINDFLPDFGVSLNKYIDIMDIGMTVNMNTLDETKKGVVNRFNTTIVKNNKIRKLNTFSSGQRGRVALCAGLALREQIKIRGSLPFDFLLIDEFADGVDKAGMQRLPELVEAIKDPVYVITHRTDDISSLFNSHVKIVYENEESRYEV